VHASDQIATAQKWEQFFGCTVPYSCVNPPLTLGFKFQNDAQDGGFYICSAPKNFHRIKVHQFWPTSTGLEVRAEHWGELWRARLIQVIYTCIGWKLSGHHLVTQVYTGLFQMIVGVLTTCHKQYTWDRSVCIFLFDRTTLQGFVTYLTGALYLHPLWFYKHQHDNR